MTITIEKLHPGEVGYRVASALRPFGKREDKTDWSGLYFASNEKVAKNYLDDDLKEPWLYRVMLYRQVVLAVCDDPKFGLSAVLSSEKAARARKQLQEVKLDIGATGLLIPSLAKHNCFFKCRLNEEGGTNKNAWEWEIIVPHALAMHITLKPLRSVKGERL